MREKVYYTYIVASRTHVLYVGVTSNLERRIMEHRSRDGSGFSARYRCDRLVWFARLASPLAAISREKEVKGSTRARKIALIEEGNRTWADLSTGWGVQAESPGATNKRATADPSFRSG